MEPIITLAVCAYNEEANIGALLAALLSDSIAGDSELLVVASGCTDRTEDIVRAVQARDSRVRLLSEDKRRGKVAAVNLVLAEAIGELVFLIDGDCLPAPGALHELLSLFDDPGVGGAGTRNFPVNPNDNWVTRAGAAMWQMHHVACLSSPVLGGDIVGLRNPGLEIESTGAINDDFLLEQALFKRGFRIAYAANARTLMRVPTTPADFVRQRRRIHFGFMREQGLGRRAKGTQRPAAVFRAAISLLKERPKSAPDLALLVILDTLARGLAYKDLVVGKNDHSAWQTARTTKLPIHQE